MKVTYIYDNISLNSYYNEKCFSQTFYRKNTFYAQKHYSENPTLYEKTWKNMVKPERP